MSDTLSSIKAEAEKKIETAGDQESLEEIRVSILGKKGALTQILKSMKDLSPEERPSTRFVPCLRRSCRHGSRA